MLSRLLVLLFLCGLFSCSSKESSKEANKETFPLIIFSHNIHGELEPCGCRHKPLGGMLQVAGFFNKLKKDHPNRNILYFDTGDSFFPATEIPDTFKKSHLFSARSLAEVFYKLSITALVPGDQDLAFGLDNYQDIINKNKLPILLTNSADNFQIPHKKSIHFETDTAVIYFLGILSPSILSNKRIKITSSPNESIKKEIENIKKNHLKKYSTKTEVYVLLSHSGMDADKKLALDFPNLDWIIGAHSQDFTQISHLVGKTQLVQVLSRNHFMGVIDLESKDVNKSFKTVEMNDLFTGEHSDSTWKDLSMKYHKDIKLIKEAELDAIGNDAFPSL